MSIKNNLHFVSIEGNWEKSIHDSRIAQAAITLMKDRSSFAIASGTYAPSSYASFFTGRLGEYTKEILIHKYGIPEMRIIPAYLFPYQSTYTIMDAFTNASLIGWMSCGLRKRGDEIQVLFEPSTSAFHGLRVETLNIRACRFLHDFNVNLELTCKNKLSFERLETEYPEEIDRLLKMQSNDGLLTTGEWSDNGKKRSYDDLQSMNSDLGKAFHAVLDFPIYYMDSFSDMERFLFTLCWNQLANSKKLSEKDYENICFYIEHNFDATISNSELLRIKNIFKIRS